MLEGLFEPADARNLDVGRRLLAECRGPTFIEPRALAFPMPDALLTRGLRSYTARVERGEAGLDAAGAPARRVRVALDLFDVAERMLRQRLRRTRPTASAADVEAAIVAWRLRRPGAEPGDAPGRLRPWPIR